MGTTVEQNNYNLLNVNFQTMIFFIEVANQNNMTAAADVLYVTQPLLSQRITGLESSLGFALFDRTRRGMALTPAGKILYDRWIKIIQEYRKSISAAEAFVRQSRESIAFGIMDNIFYTIQREIVRRVRENAGNTPVNMKLLNLNTIKASLFGGKCDIILIADYEGLCALHNVNSIVIKNIPLYACMNKKHALASKPVLKLSDLKNERLISTKLSSSGYTSYVAAHCNEFGFQPTFMMLQDTSQITFKLMFNEAVALCTAAAIDQNDTEITAIRVSDLYVPIALVWKKESPTFICRFAKRISACIENVYDEIDH